MNNVFFFSITYLLQNRPSPTEISKWVKLHGNVRLNETENIAKEIVDLLLGMRWRRSESFGHSGVKTWVVPPALLYLSLNWTIQVIHTHCLPEGFLIAWKIYTTSYFRAHKLETNCPSLHTTTFSGRVLLQGVINKTVIQKREVIVKGYWATAGLQGCVFRRKIPVVNEVKNDFVIVVVKLPAVSRAVSEYDFLTGTVAQTEVWHVEVDLFEHAALSLSAAASSSIPSGLHLLSSSPSSSFVSLLLCLLLSVSSVLTSAAQVFSEGGGSGRGGRWRHGRCGWTAFSADCYSDEFHRIFKVAWKGLVHDVWNMRGNMTFLKGLHQILVWKH